MLGGKSLWQCGSIWVPGTPWSETPCAGAPTLLHTHAQQPSVINRHECYDPVNARRREYQATYIPCFSLTHAHTGTIKFNYKANPERKQQQLSSNRTITVIDSTQLFKAWIIHVWTFPFTILRLQLIIGKWPSGKRGEKKFCKWV